MRYSNQRVQFLAFQQTCGDQPDDYPGQMGTGPKLGPFCAIVKSLREASGMSPLKRWQETRIRTKQQQ